MQLFNSLAGTEQLEIVFDDRAVLAAMVRFEVALARAQAGSRVIPTGAAEAIEQVAANAVFDSAAIAQTSRASGTIAIPFVDALRKIVARDDPSAATYVHWGATSQDISDTALILCLLEAQQVLAVDHARLSASLRRLSETHAASVMLARTLLQPASVTTFGLKAAGWFAAESRGFVRVSDGFREACVLQFGGASGTLAALGADGPRVAKELASALALPLPAAPWHAHRDRLAALVSALGIYAAALGKIARDLSLLMQFEVAEAFEPGGGSSSMPHKRNPAACAIALAAANRLPGLVAAFLSGMVQEHERGLGGWHAEASTVVAAVQATGSALAALAGAIEQLQVDPARMRMNLTATHGTVFAERAMVLLAPALGRERAAAAIASALERTATEKRPFGEMLAENTAVGAALSADVLSTLTSPEAYLGSAEHFRQRLLAGGDE